MFDPTKIKIDLENQDKNNNESKEMKTKKTENLEDIDVLNKDLTTKKEENQKEVFNEDPKEIIKEDTVKEEVTEEKTSNNEEENLENVLWKTNNNKEEKNKFSEYWDLWADLSANTEKKEEKERKKEVIFDLNISEIQDLFYIATNKQYNYILIEPDWDKIKISFKKDKVLKETIYIKYPVYSKILLKAKSLAKLDIEWTEDEQQWKWKVRINTNDFKIYVKTVPTWNWEKLFMKLEEIEINLNKKVHKKVSVMQIFWFLWALFFVSLIIWWSFLAFVVLNAKTPQDVLFFENLWINLNDVNTFVWKMVTIIFSLVLFIETIFLIIFLFKFILTKKSYKKKKIYYAIISVLTLIFTFISWTAWLVIHKKISNLPNWIELSRWNVQILDNSKLKSENFDIDSSTIKDTSNLIWPITIKYDLKNYKRSEESKWFKIKKYIWAFWDEKIIERIEPTIIHEFNEKWSYEVKLTVEEIDLTWKIITKEIKDIPAINISYIVDIKEEKLNNWWKTIKFDATDVSQLWNIEWYYGDDLKPVWKWNTFDPWKPIFDETLVWMKITNSAKKDNILDKIFIIGWENKNSIKWTIVSKQSILNDLEYEIKVKEPENDFWDGFISEFKWIIEDKEIINKGDIEKPEESSKINYTFKKYWKHNISVILKDSSWKVKKLDAVIDIPRKLKLTKWISIYNEGELLKDVKYNPKNKEYFINRLPVPTELTLDSRLVTSDNILYTLKNVTWDINSDWNIDGKRKVFKYPVDVEWNHSLKINYTFAHKKIKWEEIKLSEVLYTEWIKKEALLYLNIEKDSNYAPIIVRFDASQSQVKNQNIVKFIWDYWDSTPIEERWAINPWHRYTKAWNYEVKLTVVTEEWNSYTIKKKLILNPKPQSARINVSMKKAPVGQGIEFSSAKSEWQIESYHWTFWDWKSSFEANPSHTYTKKWKYKARLKVDFSNNNQLTDVVEIEIY